VAGTVHSNNNGTYTVAYSVEKAGAYRMGVLFDGQPVHGSPFHVTAVAGM
jgi:hypothetical protein